MLKTPLVSLLVPVLRVDQFLHECFSSISKSIFQEFELVVVAPIAERASIVDIATETGVIDRLVFIEDSGPNLAAALAKSIRCCKGTYIARLDADDVMSPERLGDQVDYLQTHPKTVLVASQIRYICEHSVVTGISKYPRKIRGGSKRFGLLDSPVAHPSVMFRSAATSAAGTYDPNFYLAEDLELWNRFIKLGNFVNLDQPLISYRQHPGQLSNTALDRISKYALLAFAVNESKSKALRPLEFSKVEPLDYEQVLEGWPELSRDFALIAKHSSRKYVKSIQARLLLQRILSRGSRNQPRITLAFMVHVPLKLALPVLAIFVKYAVFEIVGFKRLWARKKFERCFSCSGGGVS